jgi:putative oxidoreductase
MNRPFATDLTYFLLRVMAGLLFCHFGTLILFGWFGGMPGGAKAEFLSQTWIGGVLELGGGLLIALGLFTRPAAFILSGMMAVAYWQFHAPMSVWPAQNNGAAAIIFCFLFLYLSAQGGGAWSLDAVMRRKRLPSPDATVEAF